MGSRRLILAIVTLTLTIPLYAEKNHFGDSVEPMAGRWRTWAISSGKEFRAPAPPSFWETRAELREMAELISHNNEDTAARSPTGTPARRPIAGSI